MCVAADGVTLRWNRLANWAREMLQTAEQLKAEETEAAYQEKELAEQEQQSAITRLAALLQDHPDFRQATTRTARYPAAEHLHPASGPDDQNWRRVTWRAVDQATETTLQAAAEIFATYADQREQLADELLLEPLRPRPESSRGR